MEIKSEQVIYRNSVLNCRTLDIQYQHQKVRGYLLVEPNNLEEKTGGVTGIVILACYKGEIFLLRTRRPGYIDRKSWYWELPRGFVNEGESVEEAAIRELEEEVGICNISTGKISNLGCVSPEPGVIRGINKIIKLEIRDL